MPPRYFKNDQELSRRSPDSQLKGSLTRLVTEHPPDQIKPGGGLYSGPLSVAYLFITLQPFYSDLIIEDHALGTWAAAYLKRAQEHIKQYSGPKPGRCGITDDILALLAIGAASSKDADMCEEFLAYSEEVIDPKTENELLYGRAGYLYLLRYVKASFADNEKLLKMINDTQEDVIDTILDSPRPWKWMDTAYLGAVHGAIGIITQIVLSEPKKYAPKVEVDLAVLLTYQYDSGNFPASSSPEKDRLVQFCHGAPGVIISLLSIKEYFPALKDNIDKAIRKGRECILERGLLTKEPCLCHGISGNALALEDKDFEHFLTYTTRGEMDGLEKDGMLEKSSTPESLFGGEAGRAWTWAVADRNLPRRVLGYNDL